eukprot:gene24299-29516_t
MAEAGTEDVVAEALKGAIVDGEVTLLKGEVMHLGHIITSATRPLWESTRKEWMEQRKACPAESKVVEILSKARGINAKALERSLKEYLGDLDPFSMATMCRDVEVINSVESFRIAANDPRRELRGQQGIRATRDLPAWTIVGPYRARQMVKSEYDDYKLTARPGEKWGVLKHELCCETYAAEFDKFNEKQKQ